MHIHTRIALQAVELNLCNPVNLVSSLRVYVASLQDDFEKFEGNANCPQTYCVPNLQSGHKKAQKKRRKRQGCRAGRERFRLRRRQYRPSLSSITMGNMRSLPHKMVELAELNWYQTEFWQCRIMMLTENTANSGHKHGAARIPGAASRQD